MTVRVEVAKDVAERARAGRESPRWKRLEELFVIAQRRVWEREAGISDSRFTISDSEGPRE